MNKKISVRGESGAVAPAKSSVKKDEKSKSCITTIDKLIEEMKTRPPIPFYWSGIKKGSMGFVFGPAKSGKTTFCENLGMALAAGAKTFIGQPMTEGEHKVLFISLEEHCQARAERNEKQLDQITKKYSRTFTSNYLVVSEDFPRHIASDEDWTKLNRALQEFKPDVVFIDSLTRLYSGIIEESSVAKKVTEKLSDLAKGNNTTMIIVHHTPKDKDAPITIESLAGSRVLSQEADFMIGINKLSNGKRYVKEVACRYKPENERVIPFIIDDSLIIRPKERREETDLLNTLDYRFNSENCDKVLDYISNRFYKGHNTSTDKLKKEFVDSKKMSKTTLYDSLRKLLAKGELDRDKKNYSIPEHKAS